MAEPKKETVRIVLPARRDGSPIASSPRETAMINLPPKPVPVPSGASLVPPPPVIPVGLKPPASMPGMPVAPKPPSIPAIPRPPSAPGMAVPPVLPSAPVFPAGPAFPKPPSPPSATVPPMAPRPPIPPSTVPPSSAPVPPAAPKAPAPPAAPAAPVKPVAPAPLHAEVKKETAKVPASTPGGKVLPQATVQFKKPEPTTPKSVVVAGGIGGLPVPPSPDLSPVIGIAALVLALASLAVQVWMFIS